MSRFSKEAALSAGKAMTRDGRRVMNLRRVVIDGEESIIGDVVVEASWEGKIKILKLEGHRWPSSGMGLHGGHDLVYPHKGDEEK